MLRVTFVMEQHLGHQTYYQNIRRFIDGDPRVQATWVPITYEQPGGVIEKLSILPRHLRGTLRGRQQVRSGLRQAPADLFFFNTQVPAALAGGLAKSGAKYLIATDLTPIQYDAISALYGHKADKPGLLKSYKQRVNEAVFRGAARLLPWSSWAGQSLVADYGVDPRCVEVLPPGVDLTLWRGAPRNSDGPLRILFVGGDFGRKGGPLLLRAFQSLEPGEAELHLVTRSTLPDTPGVTVYNNMQPNSPDLIALYQKCDVFVLPTGAEAFGIAAVEACATGLPVIATAAGGLVDIVVDGENGFLVPSDDVAALVDRLRRLAHDGELRTQFAHAARARAETYFDAQQNAARLVDCLVDVAGAGAVGKTEEHHAI